MGVVSSRSIPAQVDVPTVSVLVPTYNSLGYLRLAIASVMAQSFPAWELIVVDDGSTDGTREWLEGLRDPRVRCIFEPHSGNLAKVRNVGIAACRAPWVAFLDADDVLLPQKLERQVAFHREHPGIRWSYTGRKLIDATGAVLPDENYKRWVPVGGWIVPQILTHEAMVGPTTMMERSLLAEVGGLDERFRYAGDYLLRLECATRSACGVVDEALTEIRQHRGSRTYQQPEAVTALAEVYRTFRARSRSSRERALCRKQEAFYRAKAAREWTDRHEWGLAARSLGIALKLKPFSAWTYRVTARWLRAMLRETVRRQGAARGSPPHP
jgi:glycosyltransferase involved in cell wall biosynthesis